MSIEEGTASSQLESEEEVGLDQERDQEQGSEKPAGEEGSEDGEAEEEDVAPVGSGEIGNGVYNDADVNEDVFEELRLGASVAEEVQSVWAEFMQAAESPDAAGEAIYAALFDAAPGLQSLFKTPRAVMTIRFMNGLGQIVGQAHDPKALKTTVETLGFQHLDLEVTVPRVMVIRDAIVDLLATELGQRFTSKARAGWCTVLNYAGGAYIYVRVKYAERLKVLGVSWAQANGRSIAQLAEGADLEAGGEGEAEAAEAAAVVEDTSKKESKGKKTQGGSKSWFASKSASGSGGKGASGSSETGFHNTSVPKTYTEMFMFNAAVMGFGGDAWMLEILGSFDTVVTNVSNSYRLQEECDILALRMSKFKGEIKLGQYKAVMLASLRSLVKDWGSLHEVSWSWLWENVERMLINILGKPAVQETALTKLFASLDEDSLMLIRREVYSKFFALAPAGQDYFKQSTTRLHFIADKVATMTLEMYKEPTRMVEDISALGLRHVGYGIPTDLFGPFVTACVQVVRMLTDDSMAEEAYRWSLNLISRILMRVINEGSTIVMKAINANSGKQLKKAVACAPRGQRALWMLNVQVGTQSISPLMWAIETGSLDAAKAIIVDLSTIRADRDRYYYGMDIIFERHPDMIKRCCQDAPALLPILLDGLVWRSRVSEAGQRRVNYYIRHFVIDHEGAFSPAIEWLTDHGDPEIVCHPVVSMVTDMIWQKVAMRTFIFGRLWFLFTLINFILSQSILNHLKPSGQGVEGDEVPIGGGGHRRLGGALEDYQENPIEVRISIMLCRIFIYFCSLGRLAFYQATLTMKDFRRKDFMNIGCLKLPAYLKNWQDMAGLFLMIFLILMLCLEPLLHCIKDSKGEHLFTEHCADGEKLLFTYSIMSTAAMMLYFLLLSDLSVFSTRVSAFVLVCGRVVSEVLLYVFGLSFFVLAFACSVCTLEQDDPDFAGIPKSALNLYRIAFGMFSGDHYDLLMDYPALTVAVFIYVVTVLVFLANLLIAQLNCAYQSTYQDMLGFARLNRGRIVVATMPSVPSKRWNRFVDGLRLDERVEFGEGDIGLAGGIQILEPASLNITTKDMIRRFGGSTSPTAEWPEEELSGDGDEADRFERMEKLIVKAIKRMSGKKSGACGGSSTGQGSSSNNSTSFALESGSVASE